MILGVELEAVMIISGEQDRAVREVGVLVIAIGRALHEIHMLRPLAIQEHEVSMRFNILEDLLAVLLREAIQIETQWQKDAKEKGARDGTH